MELATTKQYPKTFSFPRKLFTYYYFKNNPSSFRILLLSALEKKLKSLTTPLRSTAEPRSACQAIASGEWTRRENWIFSKRTYAAFLMYLPSPSLGKYEREREWTSRRKNRSKNAEMAKKFYWSCTWAVDPIFMLLFVLQYSIPPPLRFYFFFYTYIDRHYLFIYVKIFARKK